MNTLTTLTIATALILASQLSQAHPVDEYNMTQAQIDMRVADCLSDYVLDWHDKRCDFLRPEGDRELAGVTIIYDPDEGTAKPIVIIKQKEDEQ